MTALFGAMHAKVHWGNVVAWAFNTSLCPGNTGNLLVDETLRVCVADFGLARVMHDLTTLTGALAVSCPGCCIQLQRRFDWCPAPSGAQRHV